MAANRLRVTDGKVTHAAGVGVYKYVEYVFNCR